jgi:tripartite-type tricarboxylate transporter receptor subunit TctC
LSFTPKEKSTMRRLILLTLALLVAPALYAQSYPNHPIRVIVPWPPGGGTDVVARMVTQRMAVTLVQPIVIDNRPGAGGNIGIDAASKAAPDGYTFVVSTAGAAINHTLTKNLPFNILKDFEPVVVLALNQGVLVVNPSLPVHSVKEFIAYAKASPGKVTYGSNGQGSATHLWAELFKMKAGVDLLHVPYKGAAPAISDLLGGRIDAMFADIAAVLPHIKGGKLRALGVGASARFEGLPDVPTISEAGVPGYQARSMTGLLAPAGTPKEAIAAMNAAAVKALNDPEVRQGLTALAAVPVGDSPEHFGQALREEVDQWAVVIGTARIETQ